MQKLSLSPALWRLLLLSVSLVSLTTLGLYQLQAMVMLREHTQVLRPFTIGYLAPLLLMTALGGKWIGRLTLALASLMTIFFLVPPLDSWQIHRPRDLAEMAMLLVVGELLVRMMDGIRRDMALMDDVEQSPFTDSLLANIKTAVLAVPGVLSLGQCILRRRGLEYFVYADIFVSGSQTVREGLVVTSRVEEVVREAYRLIGDVKVRLRAMD